MHSTRLDDASRELLLRIAAEAIESRLSRGSETPPAESGLPSALRVERASFVTLTVEQRLRGCCGTLEPRRALAADVWHNARASAFADPRFEPLRPVEWDAADLEISVLSPLERIEATSAQDLARQLRPHVDGLVLAWRGQRATFLPQVWEQLGDTGTFLAHLKRKAGWDEGFWSADVEAWRYSVEVMVLERPALALRSAS